MSPTWAHRVRPRILPTVPRWRKLALFVLAPVAVLLGTGAWFLRVEDIPDELPPVQGDPSSIVIPPVSSEPPLALAELAGKTAFFVVVGPQSGESKEGTALNHALNRWVLPPEVVGFIVVDAEGFGVFKDKAAKYFDVFKGETRFPLYADFEGVFTRTFALPKGHHGFVVLGPDGSVLERRSGGIEGAELENLRELLSASEPPPGPPAPSFAVGSLDNASCGRGTPCALLFLGRKVARTEVPRLEDGFEGEEDEGFRLLRDPSIRLVITALRAKPAKAKAVLVGVTDDIELPAWWERVDADADGRAAFGLGPDDAAAVIIDAQGRLALRRVGSFPLFERDLVGDLLGVEFDDKSPIERPSK